jgi:hypothetical protein
MRINLDKFITLRDGSKYRGGMRGRLKHGMGENIFQDGSFYKGNYNLSQRHSKDKLDLGM